MENLLSMKLLIEIFLGLFGLMMFRESLILFFCMWWAQKSKLEISPGNFGIPALICLGTTALVVFIIKIIHLS